MVVIVRGGVYAKKDYLVGEIDLFNSPVDIFNAIKRAVASKGLAAQRLAAKGATPDNAVPKITDIVGKCHDILFYAKTVFPFHMFRNTVVLDREKVSIIYPFFFFSKKMISIPVRDLLNVEASVGPFFGSVHMSSRYFATTPCTINYLKRNDALKLQRLLQGYIICEEQKIDSSYIPKEKLVFLLNDLGEGNIKVAHG